MKITKRELRQMINESVREVLFEHGRGARLRDRTDDRWVDPLEVKSEKYKDELYKRHKEKMINKLEMLVQELKDAFPETSFRTDTQGFYWEITMYEYLRPIINAVEHSENLSIQEYIKHGIWRITGDFDEESLDELERIVNRL